MAEHAQRRAPASQPDENPPNGSRAYEELRHLIVAPEQEDLAKIHLASFPKNIPEDVRREAAEEIARTLSPKDRKS